MRRYPCADAAPQYAVGRSWHLFELQPGTKVPYRREGNEPGGFYTATADPDELAARWRRRPRSNIGLRTGEPSNTFVLDVDPRHGGDEALAGLVAKHGRLPECGIADTPTGGWHLFFAWPGVRIGPSANKLGPGLDIRCDDGYVVLDPSRRPEGEYSWRQLPVVLPAPPKWMIEPLLPKPKKRREVATTTQPASGDKVLERALNDIRTLRDGRPCNEILNACAFAVGRAVAAGPLNDSVLEDLLKAARERCESNHASSIKSGFSAGKAKAGAGRRAA